MKNPSAVVLGGGLSGVATAYTLARGGCDDVTVVERGSTLGGLAGSFERDGHFYPLGYHHILHRDRTLLFFLDLIGALPDVRWRRIRMLFHAQRPFLRPGRPGGFLASRCALADKLRFLRMMPRAFRNRDWSPWLDRSAAELIDAWAGPGVRQALFERLCELKFELPVRSRSAGPGSEPDCIFARARPRSGTSPTRTGPRCSATG